MTSDFPVWPNKMFCVVRTFNEVSLLKDDTGKGGWVSVVEEGSMCRVQLLRDDTDDRLILVFKQKAPESSYKVFKLPSTKSMYETFMA